jgi:hypothetical protein
LEDYSACTTSAEVVKVQTEYIQKCEAEVEEKNRNKELAGDGGKF